jgi:hypothetical protein
MQSRSWSPLGWHGARHFKLSVAFPQTHSLVVYLSSKTSSSKLQGSKIPSKYARVLREPSAGTMTLVSEAQVVDRKAADYPSAEPVILGISSTIIAHRLCGQSKCETSESNIANGRRKIQKLCRSTSPHLWIVLVCVARWEWREEADEDQYLPV